MKNLLYILHICANLTNVTYNIYTLAFTLQNVTNTIDKSFCRTIGKSFCVEWSGTVFQTWHENLREGKDKSNQGELGCENRPTNRLEHRLARKSIFTLSPARSTRASRLRRPLHVIIQSISNSSSFLPACRSDRLDCSLLSLPVISQTGHLTI